MFKTNSRTRKGGQDNLRTLQLEHSVLARIASFSLLRLGMGGKNGDISDIVTDSVNKTLSKFLNNVDVLVISYPGEGNALKERDNDEIVKLEKSVKRTLGN